MSPRLFILTWILLTPLTLFAEERPELNTVTGKEFVRLTRLRISPGLFERIRSELGGFENPAQLLLLFHVPEFRHIRLTNAFICTKTFHAINDVSDNDEETQEEEAAPDPIPLAGCTPSRLEAIPGMTPLMAGRIAHACRQPGLYERWQLLAVRGMTAALYGRLRRFLQARRTTLDTPYRGMLRAGARNSGETWRLPLALSLESEGFELRMGARGETGLAERRMSGIFGIGTRLPRPVTELSGYLRLAPSDWNLLIGQYRLRSPLGLLSGKQRSAGDLSLETDSMPGYIPVSGTRTPEVTSGLLGEYQAGRWTFSASAGLMAWPLREEALSNDRITSSLSSLVTGLGDIPIHHLRLGLGASWLPADWGRVSALWIRESFDHGFLPNTRRPEFTSSIRDRVLLSTGVQIGACLISGEFITAFEGGKPSSLKTRGGAGGISLADGDTRAGFVFYDRSRIHPGLLDGLASDLTANRGILLEGRTRLDETLGIEGTLAILGRENVGWKTSGRIQLEWKPDPAWTLRLRGADWVDEEGSETCKTDLAVVCRLGESLLWNLSAGLRSNQNGDGAWTAIQIDCDLNTIRIRTGYAVWQTDQGIRVWPMRPVLVSAGDGLLPGVTGTGRTAGLVLESGSSRGGLVWGALLRVNESISGWLDRTCTTSLDLAFSLTWTIGAGR
ncbi:MAG TPA: hypothetical protein PK297_09315 [Spirochaetota bacterium]|nr:hypothetical protein [Spirochaetota bacterium]